MRGAYDVECDSSYTHFKNKNLDLTLYGATSTSTAGLKQTAYDSHITHDMLPQHQIDITK